MSNNLTTNRLSKAAGYAATNDFINSLDYAAQQAKKADLLLFNISDEDVFYFGCVKELRNARIEALQMVNYLKMAAILATHLKGDIHTIFEIMDKLDEESKQRRLDIIAREEQRALNSKGSAKRRKKTAGK